MTARRVAGAGLWILFAALLVGGGVLFLRACALDALGLDYCPARPDAPLRRAAVEGEGLAREVHIAEMVLAQAPICLPPAPTAPVVVPAPVTPRPVAPRTETERIDRKVEERGGHNGRLQFTLEWATLDDLDLNVDCPGGRIDARRGNAGPGICGDGRKDVDANRDLVENVSTTPIENVVWDADVPAGTYRIEVIEYKAKSAAGGSVPFTLRIRWNGQERVCTDVVSVLPLASRRIVNGQVIGGTEKLLTWTLGDALPDCAFVTANTVRGGPQK